MGTLLSVRFLAKALKMLRGPCLVKTKVKGKKKDMIGHIIDTIRCLRGTLGEKDEDITRLEARRVMRRAPTVPGSLPHIRC